MNPAGNAALIRYLLRTDIGNPPDAGLDWWKAECLRLRVSWPDTAACAVVAGLRAPSVAFAFAAGYQSAIVRLTGREAGFGALCVSERSGNRPRDIRSTLRREDGGWRLSGDKSHVTGGTHADVLYVAASTGIDDGGRPLIRLARVDAHAPGVHVHRLPVLGFVPELPHASVRFEDVRLDDAALFEGDGHARYVKPFRSIEDVHVELALLGHMLRQTRAIAASEALQARLLGQVALLGAIAQMAPDDPSTHLLLAANRDVLGPLLAALESAWREGNPAFFSLWMRDRALLEVAGTAREARTARAWEQLRLRESPPACGSAG